MVLLRPRLRCHYCGEQCDVPKKEEKKTLRFKCKYCLAVNFLDENGDIADVPPEEAADPEGILSETDSPTGSRFESSIFCQTCVKNHLYLNEALSNYLPDLDHPEYAQFEAALPEYRKELEDRYPQVCARCEPRVREQLQQATYTAKSDHVRRMLAKSRERRLANRLGWRSLVITLSGLGYWTSIAGQLLWHAMGALSSDRIPIVGVAPSSCLQDLAIQRSLPPGCADYFGLFASHALKLGIVCVWWNPKWQHKLVGLEGRLINLDTYYQAQAGILVLRLTIWAVFQSSLLAMWMPELLKALHGVSLILLLILTIWSNYAIIKVDTTPLVNWSQDIGPLISERQFIPPQAPPQRLFSPPNTQLTASQPQQLQIDNFGTAAGQRYEPWRPPTPPVEDPDAMDWEPLNSQFITKPRKHEVKQTQPSPFHGTLPALNARGVQYANSASKPQQREAIGIPPGFFDSGRKTDGQSRGQEVPNGFAQPTFFPQQDRDALGLEKIFDDVFKLQDETAPPPVPSSLEMPQPETVPAMSSATSMTRPPQQEGSGAGSWSISNIVAILSVPFLCASLAIWVAEDFGIYTSQRSKLYMSAFASSISLLHLALKMTSIQHLNDHWLPRFGTFLSSAEVVVFATLSAYRWRYPCETRGSAGQLDPLLFCAMIWQELYYFTVAAHPEGATETPTTYRGPEPADAPAPSPNPSEATTIPQTNFGRPRSNSTESNMSDISTTLTTSTAPGWRTPKGQSRRGAPSIGGPSPGLGLGAMSLDDFGSSGANIAGPRQRHRNGGYRRARY